MKQDVNGNAALGDLNIAGRDNNITNYLTGLRRLRPRKVSPDKLMPANRFVTPDDEHNTNFDRARQAIRTSFGSTATRIVVLLAPEEHGRKSAALRLLATTNLPPDRIFELRPDWDEPDVDCLPKERSAGYLLNLRGVTEPLPDDFYDDLVAYASGLRNADSYMVITATTTVWSQARAAGAHSGILVAEIGLPDPEKIVKKYLESDESEDTRARSGWIGDTESVFHGLLPEHCAPGEAVRLASIIARAKHIKDDEALDEYHGWESHLSQWFSGGSDAVEERAVRIAGAFLDKSPAAAVLNSADLLLAAPKVDLPMPEGGLLAMPDAQSRLKPAGMSFDVTTGAASLVHESQGPAILRYLWTKHPQLSDEVLTEWLQEISQGPAKEHLGALASSLTQLAETVGIAPIFGLAEGWLQNDGKQYLELVGDLISDLAVHPTLGSQARAELATWARGKKEPARQRAVARACSGAFGKTYPSQALTRARYILNSPGSGEARQEAIDALRALACDAELTPLVVDTVVDWIANSGRQTGTPIDVFFDVFVAPSTERQQEKAPLSAALARGGEPGEAICRRLLEGWKHVFQASDDPSHAQNVLLSWRQSAENGQISQGPVVAIIIALGRAPGIASPFIKAVFTEEGPLKNVLIEALVAEIRQDVSGADAPPGAPPENEVTGQTLRSANEAAGEAQ
ncbi:hypothetical protein ACFXN2_23155 [Streptomyces kronopolitis]|uniref:hypothetical protein n=1 Tax=Streptomyces kronopolitis TaxID=1612435 RepID=UPI0036A7872A